MAVVGRSRCLVIRCAAAFLSAAALSGCRSSCEYVEAELRVQSRKVADLENALAERHAEIEALRQTVVAFQNGGVKPATPPETVYRNAALSRISLTLATGGKDADLDGKDDGVVIGVAPHDHDGDVFKCPGTCRIQLVQVVAGIATQQLGEWHLSDELLRNAWRASLLGQGYHLSFGWQKPPIDKRVKALVVFTTVDGRSFNAEKEFDVSLQAKHPPKMPGAKIEMEVAPPLPPPTSAPPPASTAARPNVGKAGDPPKPIGLGSLSGHSSLLAPGSFPTTANLMREPPPKLSPATKPQGVQNAAAVAELPSPTPLKGLNRPAKRNGEHSAPPIVEPNRVDPTAKKAPGDLADAEDVIALPPSKGGPTTKPAAPASVPPPALDKAVAPEAKKSETSIWLPPRPTTTESVVLPDDPPAPKKLGTLLSLPR